MAARTLAALLVLYGSAALVEGGASAQICGDCDGSNDVSIIDALLAAQHDVGVAVLTTPSYELCNVEGVPGGPPQGVVSILDALRIAQYVAGVGSPLTCDLPPGCTVTTPAPGIPAQNVTVSYRTQDLFSRTVDLTVEFSTSGGGSWTPATQAGGDPVTGLSASPAPGEPHTYIWSSTADAVGNAAAQSTMLRLTVSNGGGSSSCTTGAFDVDNTPPVQLTTDINDGHVYCLAHDPVTPTVVYAGTGGGGMYRSSDAGATWSEINSGLEGTFVTSIAIHPLLPSVLWISVFDDRAAGARLYRSTDSGATWAHHGTGLVADRPAYCVIYHQGDAAANRMFASIGVNGVLRSMDGGDTWVPSGNGLPATGPVRALAGGAFNPNTAWATVTGEGVYRTNDGGVNWAPALSGLPLGADPVTLVASPSVASNIWVVLPTAPYVYRSVSSGNWWSASSGLTHAPHSLRVAPSDQSILWAACGEGQLWQSTNWGIAWLQRSSGLTDDEARSVSIDPADPDRLVSGGLRGTHLSSTGGATWSHSDAHLSATMPRTVVYDPVNPQRIYMGTCVPGTTDGCLWRSTDSGATWIVGLTDPACSDVRDLLIDPVTPGNVYACVGGLGLHASSDSGVTWTPRTAGMPGSGSCLRMVGDPGSFGTFYIAHDEDECYKSSDAGVTWTRVNSGITGVATVKDLDLNPASPQELLLATDGEGVYRTTNGAGSWSPVNTGLGSLAIWAVAYAPSNPSVAYCGSGDPHAPQVYRSDDGGLTWTAVGAPLGVNPCQIQRIAVDPSDEDKVYVGTDLEGLWRSVDGGLTWNPENTGLFSRFVGYLGFQPGNPASVFIGSAQGLTVRTF